MEKPLDYELEVEEDREEEEKVQGEKIEKLVEEVEDKLEEYEKTIKDAKEILYGIILSVVSDESDYDDNPLYRLIFRDMAEVALRNYNKLVESIVEEFTERLKYLELIIKMIGDEKGLRKMGELKEKAEQKMQEWSEESRRYLKLYDEVILGKVADKE